jgi:FixJ family two-component response regulator
VQDERLSGSERRVSYQYRIPVVEDDASLRTAIVGLLRMLGYLASGHASAEALLASGEARSADCLVCDICLPGISGIDLKRRLDASGARAPVIMITGRSNPALRDAAMAAGAVAVLPKPFAADRLIECVEQALAAR